MFSRNELSRNCCRLLLKAKLRLGWRFKRCVFYFFEEIYKQRCVGIDANVPTSLTETEAERFGTIITQAYIQHNVFPVRLAKAIFEYLIFNNVQDKTLIESLLLYIHNRERDIIRKRYYPNMPWRCIESDYF